jgi:hypothetical protein
MTELWHLYAVSFDTHRSNTVRTREYKLLNLKSNAICSETIHVLPNREE